MSALTSGKRRTFLIALTSLLLTTTCFLVHTTTLVNAACPNPNSGPSSGGVDFATFFKQLCVGAGGVDSNLLNSNANEICCFDQNSILAAPKCGSLIAEFQDTTLLCVAPLLLPTLQCLVTVSQPTVTLSDPSCGIIGNQPGTTTTTGTPVDFATYFKRVCLNAEYVDSNLLNNYSNFVCCGDAINITAPSRCGEQIRSLQSTTVQCVAPLILPAFTCCANVNETGGGKYVGLTCASNARTGNAAAAPLRLLGSATTAAAFLVAGSLLGLLAL